MKTILNLTLLGVLSLGFGACSDNVVDSVSSWKSDACACKDKACAEKEGKAFLALQKKFKDADKPSKEDKKKLNKLANEGQDCLEKHGVDVYAL